jgi:group I intron endonuclease
MPTPGIYKITNLLDGKIYVGSSKWIERRFTEHINRLRAGEHHSPYLQNAWEKHGEGSFDFAILEVVEVATDRIVREQFWIDLLRAFDKRCGYNVCPAAGTVEGIKRTSETIERIRLAAIKRHETHGSPTTGRKHTETAKGKISAAHSGREHTAEARARMKAASQKRALEHPNGFSGKAHSDETRTKMRAAWERRRQNFVPHVHTAEQRAKMSAALTGRKLSDETKGKLREIALNRASESRNG